jgi:hypothetical protein
MGCIVAVIALLFPRITIVVLWLFTGWFNGVFNGALIPVLGFLFMPVTTLWYSVVVNRYGGEWNTIAVVGMVIAVVIDLSTTGGSYKQRKRR